MSRCAPRPLNGWIYFQEQHRSTVKFFNKEISDAKLCKRNDLKLVSSIVLTLSVLAKRVAQKWKALPVEDQQRWHRDAEEITAERKEEWMARLFERELPIAKRTRRDHFAHLNFENSLADEFG
jgi:hypothetical protein